MLGVSLSLSACTGLFDGIYDNGKITEKPIVKEGQLYVDASSWLEWHYIDFEELLAGDSTVHVTSDSIPLTASSTSESISTGEGGGRDISGIYTYWYDVFGEGVSRHEYRDFYATASQSEPSSWSIAVHRNNVRTNGGAVYETQLTNMSDLPESSDAYKDMTFTEDEWNETDVWTIQEKMLLGLIGNQGIRINNVMSSWLKVDIPPMPPQFTHNNHVFIIRCANGKYAAIQLENYMSQTGTKCCLTINYKYPF